MTMTNTKIKIMPNQIKPKLRDSNFVGFWHKDSSGCWGKGEESHRTRAGAIFLSSLDVEILMIV